VPLESIRWSCSETSDPQCSPAKAWPSAIFLWFWATVIGSAIALALTFRLGPEAVPTRYHVAWAFALLVSGGICYLLTRYLTAPVLRLSAAARLLAEGELTARATDAKPRRDEIGELVRDFELGRNLTRRRRRGCAQLLGKCRPSSHLRFKGWNYGVLCRPCESAIWRNARGRQLRRSGTTSRSACCAERPVRRAVSACTAGTTSERDVPVEASEHMVRSAT
jgi:HAMP domain-containing protein